MGFKGSNIFGYRKPGIEFFTVIKGLADVAPPISAAQCIPDWFKTVNAASPDTGIDPNLKLRGINTDVSRCPGLHDMMTQGHIIPLWCDYQVSVDPDGTVNWLAPDGMFKLASHPFEQLKGMPQNHEYPALKFINPWLVRTPPGYSCLFQAPYYHFEKRFSVLPGIVDTDIYHNAHLPTLLSVDPGQEIMIERGTPLVQVIPFRREKLGFDFREATDEDERAIAGFQLGVRSTFGSDYRKHKQQVREGKPD
jgi:hypothetical protein